MTNREAKRILALYRPDSADHQDPEIAAALDQARRDPELQRWLEQYSALQRGLRAKFRGIEPPADLAARMLAAHHPVSHRPAPRPFAPVWWAAAAALVLVAVLVGLWTRQPDRKLFTNYRSRIVASALREYRLDIPTQELASVRQFMAAKKAPADFVVPPALQEVPLLGGNVLSWEGHPVSMVCFDRGSKDMLFLFVIDRNAVGGAPTSPQAEFVMVNKLLTANWTRGDKTYVLAGEADQPSLAKYSAVP